jgi:hypothetical protein
MKSSNRTKFVPECQGTSRLETRALLSALSHAAPAVVSIEGLQQIGGNLSGTFTGINSGVDLSANIKGSGNVSGLGKVQVTGRVHSVGEIGFMKIGPATGTITLKAKGGTIIAAIASPELTVPVLSTTYSYRITKATGHYAGTTGSGTLTLVLKTTRTTPDFGQRGTFTATIN